MRRFALLCAVACLVALASAPLRSSAFAPGTYDPVFARRMLDLAGACYCHADQIEAWDCAFCKEEPTFQLTGTYINATTNMQVIVGFDAKSASVVLAFKGTSPTSIVNWLQDLTYEFLDEECPECAVHEGFYDTYLSVRYQAVGLLQQAFAAHPDAPLTITGHSLGGALANIAAVDLSVVEGLTARMIITFGQPRTGNQAYRDYYTKIFNESTSWRVTHGADPVPHVPTLDMKYVHPAYEVYYDVLNLSWKQCDASGEDPTCADHWLAALDPLAHGLYLSGDFLKQFLACQLYAQQKGEPIQEVREPGRPEQEVKELHFGEQQGAQVQETPAVPQTQPQPETATEPELALPTPQLIAFA